MRKYIKYLIILLLIIYFVNKLILIRNEYSVYKIQLNNQKNIYNSSIEKILDLEKSIKLKNKRIEEIKLLDKSKIEKLIPLAINDNQLKKYIIYYAKLTNVDVLDLIISKDVNRYYNFSFNDVNLKLYSDLLSLANFFDMLYKSQIYFDTSRIYINLTPKEYIINISYIEEVEND